MQYDFIPVLLGADLNCYNIARAFHERYGVRSHAFGKYAIGVTQNTRIIDFEAVAGLDEPDTLVSTLLGFAESHRGVKLIAFGCTDLYVELLSQSKDRLGGSYIIPYADYALIRELTAKDRFYSLCEKNGVPYPKTVVLAPGDEISIPFDYPVIIKPSVSADYWKHEFEGMKKVYRAADEAEARDIIGKIRGSGYPDSIIVQDMIPGDDSFMYVLTAYCDKNAKVRMLCLGHVLLEEHTPKGLGNHAAIITEYNRELMERFKALLEKTGFTGYANFDIKLDSRDGSLRAFEINVRLGRSNYYVTAAGNNVAEYIVRDYIEGGIPGSSCVFSENQIYWRYIPDSIVYKYSSPELCGKVKALKKSGKAFSSMRYSYDLKYNPKRFCYICLHEFRHIGKFRKYYK